MTPKPQVPPGTLVCAIGDIHGRVDLLAALHDRIRRHAAASDAGRRVVVYLGDYVDRGPRSRGVIDLLLDAPLPGFAAVHLCGNHEDLMLRFLDDAAAGPDWFMNGGDATLESYGVDALAFGRGGDLLGAVQAALRDALPARHRDFLGGLALTHVEGDYLFVHAGIRPGVPLEHQRREDLLWIRGLFLDDGRDHRRLVVHGHTIAAEPVLRANRIGIDTGACFTGRLTCLALEGDRQVLLGT